jgi:hypothetical protein
MTNDARFALRLAALLTASALLRPCATADAVRSYGNLDPLYRGKDVGLGTYALHGNGGAKSSIRLGKPYLANPLQNYALFDWNRTTILADMESVARAQGWRDLRAAWEVGAVTVELGVKAAAADLDPPTKSVLVGCFASQTAWVEGAGLDQDTDYAWSNNTSACTDSFAVDWNGGGTPVPWRENGVNLVSFRDLTFQWNSRPLTNFYLNQFTYVALDPPLWWNYLHATNAGPGIATRDAGTGGNPNMAAYTDDQNTGGDPELRATIRTKRPGVRLVVR